MKPKIVLSGVNFTGLGPLAAFQEAIASHAEIYSGSYDIIALVHRASLFDIAGVTFIEQPEIKSSWFKRIRFEYYDCLAISKRFDPYLWFAMHDMTPNVRAKVRAVYCHNPSPFYSFSAKDALLDWKFGLFTLLYRFLYRINIRANDFVVVQQDWMRSDFRSRYGLANIVVAHPSVNRMPFLRSGDAKTSAASPYKFFYPAYPRVFKNCEQILKAARRLGREGVDGFELWLTMDGTESSYAEKMVRSYSDVASVRWLGLLPRSKVLRLYAEADCLLFPSKLETWGMPITEFKETGKPILAVDLPYARETIGEYARAAFFQLGDDELLAAAMRQAVSGTDIFGPVKEQPIAQPFSRDWEELWNILLAAKDTKA